MSVAQDGRALLKMVKVNALGALKEVGAFDLMRDSTWRRNRLLILCYHGVSMDDEHEWDPHLFVSPAHFESRLRLLRDGGYRVLPFGEAVERLYAGTLPPRSVCITFDDGFVDFQERALPLLDKYGFPATVYLTTYYSELNRPIFTVFCRYLMWKARGQTVDTMPVTGERGTWDLTTPDARDRAFRQLYDWAEARQYSGHQKDELLRRLASALGVDYDALVARRLLHLLTPNEVQALDARGVDFQLHTHRHHCPHDRDLFLREIDDNRRRMQAMLGRAPAHFCYPSGLYRHEFLPWLREAKVTSATIGETRLATPATNPLLLPRLIDTTFVTPIEFEGWLTGVSEAFPSTVKHAGLQN